MASSQPAAFSPARPGAATNDFRLHEANHRCSNDLQMVVSLLALESSRSRSQETRQALTEVMTRVAVLARSRKASLRSDLTLGDALRHLCEALSAQAEPHAIQVSLDIADDDIDLSAGDITTLAMVVNELSTNAIKHAFEADIGGDVRVSVRKDGKVLIVIVDDDGLPFPELHDVGDKGFGLNLVEQMVQSIGGRIDMPTDGTKVFEIRVPLSAA